MGAAVQRLADEQHDAMERLVAEQRRTADATEHLADEQRTANQIAYLSILLGPVSGHLHPRTLSDIDRLQDDIRDRLGVTP